LTGEATVADLLIKQAALAQNSVFRQRIEMAMFGVTVLDT
jgi:hypothetical protein